MTIEIPQIGLIFFYDYVRVAKFRLSPATYKGQHVEFGCFEGAIKNYFQVFVVMNISNFPPLGTLAIVKVRASCSHFW